MKLTLIGVDPGVVDTAATSIALDFQNRAMQVRTRVWTNVTMRDGFKLKIDRQFLAELATWTEDHKGIKFSGVEGYRPRGYDKQQDDRMQFLVQACSDHVLNSVIVDNTSMKKIVKEGLLEVFHCKRFPGTNHADSKSAARVALRTGLNYKAVNTLLADCVIDNLDNGPWALVP